MHVDDGWRPKSTRDKLLPAQTWSAPSDRRTRVQTWFVGLVAHGTLAPYLMSRVHTGSERHWQPLRDPPEGAPIKEEKGKIP